MDKTKHTNSRGIHLPGYGSGRHIIIPYYTFLTMFLTWNQLEQLSPSAQNFTTGFHPRSAQHEFPGFMTAFQKLVGSEPTIAVEEVGLDYTLGVLN